MFSYILQTRCTAWGLTPLWTRPLILCWWHMVLKALVVSTNTMPSSQRFFFAHLITTCSSFKFSEHPAAWINPLCLGLMLRSVCHYNSGEQPKHRRSNGDRSPVINVKVFIQNWRLQNHNFWQSFSASGIVLVTSQRLKVSVNGEYLGFALTRWPNIIPSSPGAEVLLISLTSFSTSSPVIRAWKTVLSTSLYGRKDSKPQKLTGISHLDLKAE